MRARIDLAFTGSTLAVIDKDTGEVYRVPGFLPERERSFWWRLRQTIRASRQHR
jgi:hypothetical protein